MKIVVASPLFPPDTAPLAQYVKELAHRLAHEHSVTVITYGHLVESIPHVKIVTIDRRSALPTRIWQYTRVLIAHARNADVVYAQNGASVELPALITTLCVHTPHIGHLGDHAAHRQATQSLLHGLLEKWYCRRMRDMITHVLPERPEIIPFEPVPTEAQTAYADAWTVHMNILTRTMHHVTH